jgi:hypothetical protein
LVAAFAVVALGSCSSVRFERGPYAIRALEVVYSAQEDLTFFSWRLREDARLDRVEFELFDDGDFVPIELEEAPFPADPYRCGKFWCFQYQVPGEYQVPEEYPSPMRSVHDDQGVFMGSPERSHRVETTFGIDPIGLDQNEAIDPNRFDWFADNGIRFRRDYEWQFTDWEDNACAEPSAGQWQPMVNPVDVSHAWTDRAVAGTGICFNARPLRADADGAVVQAFMVPSAETTFETQSYVPPRQNSPIVWGMLVDLEIPNETRCRQVKGRIIDIVEAAIEARGDAQKLGIYTPTDPETGEELGGCDQAPERDYPFEQMLRDAKTVQSEEAPTEVKVMWVFVNNIELPPPERVLEQLQLFGLALALGGGDLGEELPPGVDMIPDEELGEFADLAVPAYTWAIGSNVFMNLFPWNVTTGWRPVEDKTLTADVKSVAKRTLPFATMLHEPMTEVEIQRPAEAESRPLYFKTCSATPVPLDAVGVIPGQPQYGPADTIPWPEFDDYPPYYRVTLEEQRLVPRTAYIRRRLEVVVEVCTAFCDGPFRTRGGEDYTNWRGIGVCRWSE